MSNPLTAFLPSCTACPVHFLLCLRVVGSSILIHLLRWSAVFSSSIAMPTTDYFCYLYTFCKYLQFSLYSAMSEDLGSSGDGASAFRFFSVTGTSIETNLFRVFLYKDTYILSSMWIMGLLEQTSALISMLSEAWSTGIGGSGTFRCSTARGLVACSSLVTHCTVVSTIYKWVRCHIF